MVLIMSLAAGVLGTGIGGALGALFADKGQAVSARVLAFAGGVMLGVTCFDMLPEAIGCMSFLGVKGGIAALGAAGAGAVGVGLLSLVVDALGKKRSGGAVRLSAIMSVAQKSEDKRRMMKAGGIMLFAIALHNLPEGMAIGGAGAHELAMGASVAIVIAVHNVPEGMAIAAPLAGGGVKAWKAVALTALAGGTTAVGAAIGLALGGLGDVATGICLGVAGGAMLFVTFFDILPGCVQLAGKLPSLSILAGILCAACFAYVA